MKQKKRIKYSKKTIKKCLCLLIDALDEEQANDILRRATYSDECYY